MIVSNPRKAKRIALIPWQRKGKLLAPRVS
jgi:hypothetical protein